MNKFLRKHWPVLGIGVLLTVVGFYLFGAQGRFLAKPILGDILSKEGIRLADIHYTQDNPDQGTKWVLDAEEVTFSKDRKFMSFNNFLLNVESKDRPSIKLKGKTGDYDTRSGVINLRGDLQGDTENGYRIMTEQMTYKNKDGFLKTDKPVKIVGPLFSVEGTGLLFNLEKKTLKINRDVITVLKKGAFII
jgi:LPS export ABC transporter protein LptC